MEGADSTIRGYSHLMVKGVDLNALRELINSCDEAESHLSTDGLEVLLPGRSGRPAACRRNSECPTWRLDQDALTELLGEIGAEKQD